MHIISKLKEIISLFKKDPYESQRLGEEIGVDMRKKFLERFEKKRAANNIAASNVELFLRKYGKDHVFYDGSERNIIVVVSRDFTKKYLSSDILNDSSKYDEYNLLMDVYERTLPDRSFKFLNRKFLKNEPQGKRKE